MSSTSGSIPGDVFDVRKVRKFIELMNEHDLAEIDLRQGDQRIRRRRGPEMVTVATTPAGAPGPPAASTALSEAPGSETAVDDSNKLAIRSAIVGTFYLAANPPTPELVQIS